MFKKIYIIIWIVLVFTINPIRELSSLTNEDGDFIPPSNSNNLYQRQESMAFSNGVNINSTFAIEPDNSIKVTAVEVERLQDKTFAPLEKPSPLRRSFSEASNNIAFINKVFKNHNLISSSSHNVRRTSLTGFASIVINDCVKIEEILIIKENDREFIKFPEYINKAGRIYPQIIILDREIKKDIEKAILLAVGEVLPKGGDGVFQKDVKSQSLDYKITRVYLLKGKNRKANVEVTFNESVKITCGIMENDNGRLWVSWPSRKDSQAGWITQVNFFDITFKEILEQEIINKYTAVKSEQP